MVKLCPNLLNDLGFNVLWNSVNLRKLLKGCMINITSNGLPMVTNSPKPSTYNLIKGDQFNFFKNTVITSILINIVLLCPDEDVPLTNKR